MSVVFWIIGILLVLFLIYLLLIMPRVYHRPSVKPLLHPLYAHRGLYDNDSDAPENSMAAFRLAVENGYGIELDVQLSKDNIPVVIHDYSLKRICGVDKKVSELTFDELQQLHLANSKEKIPLFSDVLNLIGGKVPLIIELKIEARDLSVCPLAARLLDEYPGVYCVESFNPLGLVWYKKNRPAVVRGQLASNFLANKEPGNKALYFCLQNLLLNCATRPDFIAFDILHQKMLSFSLCRRLYHTLPVAWTVRSDDQLEDAKKRYQIYIFEHFIPK